jgi:hypothetical protein
MSGQKSIQLTVVWAALLTPSFQPGCLLARQSGSNISEFFEGRKVVVRLDMPGTHQGIDIYPQRPQPFDAKSYGNRLKQFGVSLRNGDSAMVTKVKVKDGNVEFQLGGGGYGTAGDDTDTSVHFTALEKSSREKDLERDIKAESNSDRRRSLQRDLEEIRSDRERHDRHERQIAEEAAESKRRLVADRRMKGGSRFNLRQMGPEVTPQVIMSSLADYVVFPPESFAGSPSALAPQSQRSEAPSNQPAAPVPEPSPSLRKGLRREQVEAIYGPASEAHENNQSGMTVVSCTYKTTESIVKADFVNGVLVQYSVSSR